MKNLLVFTALAFGVAVSHQALACDWMHEANQDSTTVVTCANGKCEAVPSRLPSKLRQRRLCLKLTLTASI
jgi:hypothetical protein